MEGNYGALKSGKMDNQLKIAKFLPWHPYFFISMVKSHVNTKQSEDI